MSKPIYTKGLDIYIAIFNESLIYIIRTYFKLLYKDDGDIFRLRSLEKLSTNS